MPHTLNIIPEDPKALVEMIRQESKNEAVLIMKLSPICPISHGAEDNYRTWLAGISDDTALKTIELDVIEQRPLARGLTAELDIKHESPQALVFKNGELVWHDSHQAISAEALSSAIE